MIRCVCVCVCSGGACRRVGSSDVIVSLALCPCPPAFPFPFPFVALFEVPGPEDDEEEGLLLVEEEEEVCGRLFATRSATSALRVAWTSWSLSPAMSLYAVARSAASASFVCVLPGDGGRRALSDPKPCVPAPPPPPPVPASPIPASDMEDDGPREDEEGGGGGGPRGPAVGGEGRVDVEAGGGAGPGAGDAVVAIVSAAFVVVFVVDRVDGAFVVVVGFDVERANVDERGVVWW
ncbi:hypothetical protein FA13DRAFT_306736 [Coprinellus micaceus]|uniref:Uncharacterized protein n=1 Tax=Coprinellus micaceus TaxID=71717 RepID=A0A4Y7SE81_COPMI|nr:hypothetical protein FA13DRAFT_306736 [Coprinellus micaceus]